MIPAALANRSCGASLNGKSHVALRRTVIRFCFFLACLSFTRGTQGQNISQQFIYTSAPTSQASVLNGSQKIPQTGAISLIAGSPFNERFDGAQIIVDALGRFLFVLNPTGNSISMFQIDPASGALKEAPASPFAIGPTEVLNVSPANPQSIAVEPSGKFLYVGYVAGSIPGSGEIDEFAIDATNVQLVPIPSSFIQTSSGPVAMTVDPKGHFSLYVVVIHLVIYLTR